VSSSILCVHQVGKVGSTTVAHVLQRMYPDRRVHQTHVFDEVALLKSLVAWMDHPDSPRTKLSDHLVSSVELRKFLGAGGLVRDWWMISLVREPMGRNVSAFFQNLDRKWIFRLSAEGRRICERVLKPSVASDAPVTPAENDLLVGELIELFKTRWRGGLYDRWFDRELRGVFGIDVFDRPFDREQGYQFFQRGTTRLMLLRLEDLPRVFLPALEKWFAGSEFAAGFDRSFSLERERSNDGSTKAYSDLYQSFREKLRIDARQLDAIYSSRVARHFYSDEEIAGFRARWKTHAEASAS